MERFAHLISTIQISGTFPGDITTKEYNEIALWDAIGNRAVEIINSQGTVGTISLNDLKPREQG